MADNSDAVKAPVDSALPPPPPPPPQTDHLPRNNTLPTPYPHTYAMPLQPNAINNPLPSTNAGFWSVPMPVVYRRPMSLWWPMSFLIVWVTLGATGGALMGVGLSAEYTGSCYDGSGGCYENQVATNLAISGLVFVSLSGLFFIVFWVLFIIWIVKRGRYMQGPYVVYTNQSTDQPNVVYATVPWPHANTVNPNQSVFQYHLPAQPTPQAQPQSQSLANKAPYYYYTGSPDTSRPRTEVQPHQRPPKQQRQRQAQPQAAQPESSISQQISAEQSKGKAPMSEQRLSDLSAYAASLQFTASPEPDPSKPRK